MVKTKNFREYLESRLSKEEIEECEDIVNILVEVKDMRDRGIEAPNLWCPHGIHDGVGCECSLIKEEKNEVD